MPTARKFTELEVWQLSSELQKKIYALIEKAPLSKDFALKDQMNRSCGSVPDNIAEGFGRAGRNEFIQFLGYARASASELQSQIMRCYDRKFIDQKTYIELYELADKTGNKIGSFIKYLNSTPIRGEKFKNRVPTTDFELKNNLPLNGDQYEKRETLNFNKKESNEETKHTFDHNKLNEKQEKRIPNKNESNEVTKQTFNNNKPIEKRKTIINTTNAAKPLGAYPHSRIVGNLLFLSGIGSRQASDNKIPGLELDSVGNILKYDIEAECHSVFANVKAVLEASGSSWEKMVDVTVYLTNMKKDFPAYNRIYGEYFKEVNACRTTVEVKSLPTPIAIELKVIATI